VCARLSANFFIALLFICRCQFQLRLPLQFIGWLSHSGVSSGGFKEFAYRCGSADFCTNFLSSLSLADINNTALFKRYGQSSPELW